MYRNAISKGLLLIVILSLSIMPVLGNDKDKGIEQHASSVNYSRYYEETLKKVALDKGDPLYPKNIEGLSKEELIKRGFGTVNPSYPKNIEIFDNEKLTKTANPPYPKNIEGLSKEELIKRGFGTVNKSYPKNIEGLTEPSDIGRAVDNMGPSWFLPSDTSPDYSWSINFNYYVYGDSAAVSNAHLDYKQAIFSTKVLGMGKVSFYWSVSSEQGYDYLEFYIDGVLRDRISGNVPWELKSYDVGGVLKTHTFKWRYIKDGSVSVGYDAGFVDKFKWTGFILLGDALDNPGPWFTEGSTEFSRWLGWIGQQDTFIVYDAAAKSTALGDYQYNSLTNYNIYGPGTLWFIWKVSSEAGYDYLEFYIDGVRKDRISGNVPWKAKTYPLSSGRHTVKWRYIKDGSVSIGSDAGWVDDVHIWS